MSAHLTETAPAMSDPTDDFDAAIDAWAEAMAEGDRAWVIRLHDGADETERAADVVRARLNARRWPYPEWLEDFIIEGVSE